MKIVSNKWSKIDNSWPIGQSEFSPAIQIPMNNKTGVKRHISLQQLTVQHCLGALVKGQIVMPHGPSKIRLRIELRKVGESPLRGRNHLSSR